MLTFYCDYFRTDDRTPIQHELFDKFLTYRDGAEPPFAGQSTLKAWQEKNHPWLELSDVHKETTEDIRVTVIPFYMGYRDNQANNVYWVKLVLLEWLIDFLFWIVK